MPFLLLGFDPGMKGLSKLVDCKTGCPEVIIRKISYESAVSKMT
jgi:hypothetical protein